MIVRWFPATSPAYSQQKSLSGSTDEAVHSLKQVSFTLRKRMFPLRNFTFLLNCVITLQTVSFIRNQFNLRVNTIIFFDILSFPRLILRHSLIIDRVGLSLSHN